MSHTFTSNRIHVVFSTKERRPVIHQPSRLWAYMAGIAKNHGVYAHAIGGIDNHVHALLTIPPTLPLSKAVQTLKANSSRWMHENGADAFEWQEGYSAFSVSESLVPAVVDYIEHQEEHHRKRDYKAELEALLRKHGIRFSPSDLD